MRDHHVTAGTVYRAVLLAFLLVGVVLAFSQIATLLLLILLAAIVAVPLSAVADRMQRFNVPRGVTVPVTLVLAVVVFAGIIAALVPTFIHEGKRLVDEIPSIVASLNHTLGRGGSHTTNVGHSVHNWIAGYTQHPHKLLGPATTIAAGIGGVVGGVLVIAFTSVFSAISPDSLRSGIVRLVPPRNRPQARTILHRLATAYLGWLVGLAISMAVLGTLTYAGLTIVGIPYALVFAVLTAMATVVPYYGALLSYIPPIAVALTISVPKALFVLVVCLFVHFVEGNLVSPLVMARAVKLHPALVAAGVLAVERLIGFVGLIVAVPILVTLKILVEELWIKNLESGEELATGERVEPGEAVDFVTRPRSSSGPLRLLLPTRGGHVPRRGRRK
jgi:predicted PurR-regulated permease PerM